MKVILMCLQDYDEMKISEKAWSTSVV